MRDRESRAPRSQSLPPTGIVERGMYARAIQEPGMESRRSCAAGTERQEKSSRPGGERSERAVRAMTWGNPLQGTLPSKGARRRTDRRRER